VKRDFSLIVLGVLLGAISMNIHLASRLDTLYLDREKLRVSLYETTERLKKIEAQWQDHRTMLVREVEIQFSKETQDVFLEVALRQAVIKLTQELVGEKLDLLSPYLAVQLLDRRIVEADNGRYRLFVRTLILSEKTTYILDYEPLTAQSDDEP
jgi:Fe-S cluster biosynthesis and repair protein YggX